MLRRAGLVVTRKDGAAVYYSLTSPRVAELLAVARGILTEVLSEQMGLLADLQAPVGVSDASPAAGSLVDAAVAV